MFIFFTNITGKIEIIDKNKELKNMYFLIEPECYYISSAFQTKFAKHIPVGSSEEKIKYMFNQIRYLKMNMNYYFERKSI